jgi:hypothetical protein
MLTHHVFMTTSTINLTKEDNQMPNHSSNIETSQSSKGHHQKIPLSSTNKMSQAT